MTDEIKKTLLEYYEAFHNRNWQSFSDYLADEFTYYTDSCSTADKTRFLEFLAKDTWRGTEYNITDIDIRVSSSGDIALATYKTSFTGGDNSGKDMTVIAIETSIFRNIEEKWKLIHSHTSNKIL